MNTQCVCLEMLRVNPKILALGAGLLVAGFVLVVYLAQIMPAGQTGMTEQEIAEFLLDEQQNTDFVTLASILVGLGFLLILISFGTARGEGGAKPRRKTKYAPPSA